MGGNGRMFNTKVSAFPKMMWLVLGVSSICAAQQNVVGAMAQVASGGGQWTTSFTLINAGPTSANITLNFFDDTGNALTLPFFFPQTSTTALAASLTSTISPNSELLIQTDGLNDTLATGWA